MVLKGDTDCEILRKFSARILRLMSRTTLLCTGSIFAFFVEAEYTAQVRESSSEMRGGEIRL